MKKSLLKSLSGKTIAVDTMLFIYLLEGHKQYFALARKVFDLAEKKKIKLITSFISYIETLSSPLLDEDRIELYGKFFLSAKSIELHAINHQIADKAAYLRRVYSIRTPDAVQIATSLVAQADFFISNDKRLAKVKEMEILWISDLNKQL